MKVKLTKHEIATMIAIKYELPQENIFFEGTDGEDSEFYFDVSEIKVIDSALVLW